MGGGTQVLWWSFQHPGRLWALLVIPALIILYILALHFSQRKGVRYTNTGIVGAVAPHRRQWRRHVSVAMALCSLAAIGAAWAMPMGTTKVPRERATVVLILDVSQSMQATDVSPNRLQAAKDSALKFIANLPIQYNVALVSLSGHPSTLVPPTVDRSALTQAINNLQLSDGTAIASAINDGLDALNQAPAGTDGGKAPGMMVLMSDGGETAGGDPVAAATQAKQHNVPIYTIAFGTQNGYVDLDGQRFNVAPDKQLLAQVAQASSGKAMDATNASQLDDAYKNLQSDVGYENERTQVTAQWALYALAFAVVAGLGAVSMATRWP